MVISSCLARVKSYTERTVILVLLCLIVLIMEEEEEMVGR